MTAQAELNAESSIQHDKKPLMGMYASISQTASSLSSQMPRS